MAENAGGAALEHSAPIGSFIDSMFGGYPSGAEPESSKGAPPVETPEGDEPTVESSEGTDPSAIAPDASTEPAPDTESQPTTDADPLEGASPLTYTVAGEQRTYDGITVLKDNGGAIIDPERLPDVIRKLSERDHLFEKDQQRHREAQDLDQRLAWTPPGADKPVSGVQAAEALHHDRASLLATVKAYETLLSNPENIRQILSVDEQSGQLTWNQMGVDNFLLKLANTRNEVRSKLAEYFGKLSAPSASPQTFEPTAYTAAAIQATGAKLSADDQKWAESLAPRFIRVTTAEDVQANPQLKLGAPMVEQAICG
jgi:hypothetical protein